ncbi:UNVERIFIED_CONTAM: TonB-dependent receptor [Euhalothece sp. KZN 001]
MNNHQITNFIRTYQDLPRYDNLVQFNHFWRRQMIRSGTTILMFLLLTTITEAKPLNNHLLIAQNNRETDCEEGEERNPETGECEETSDYDFEEDITIDEVDLEITITATKTPRFVLDSTASIVIVESEAIEQQVMRSIRDLVRYEPGVSVGRNPNRFGNQGFNIRGIDGNRVLIQIDGIRTADNYVGRGRDFFNLETIERVEIVKGPASALYGSDAIGGVVSFITKDPEDYLNVFGDSIYTSLTTNYGSAQEGNTTTGIIAVEDETGTIEASSAVTISNNSEFKNFGEIASNPQDGNELNILTKLVYNLNENNSFKLTGEILDSTTDTTLITEVGRTSLDVSGGPPVFFQREEVEAEDKRKRDRISLNYDYENSDSSWLQKANFSLYYQNSQIEEDKVSTGIRQPTFPPVNTPIERVDINEFKQDVFGSDVQLESNFAIGNSDHRLVYGVEIYNTETSRPRDSSIINLNDGSITKFVAGEEFPNKTFPDTDTFRLAAYVQDEIEIGQFSIIPGIRWDYYSLTANEDADFARINVNNFEVEDVNESAFSPKLGIVYKATSELAFYGQYARGFRSPPYDDANIGFTNFAFGYTVLPNGDLEPETSDSFELGIRGAYPSLNFTLAGFYNDYDNFIDTVGLGPRPSDGFLQFQSQNIDQAEIYGLEAELEYFLTGNKSNGFSLIGSIAWAKGDNTSQDESVPLNSVNPIEAIVGLRYRAPENRWGTELIATIVGEKTRIDGDDLFAPDGYTTVDLIGYYNLSDRTSINLGLFNLLNEKYFVWSDVEGRTNADPDLERFAQPGFNAAASVRFRF